MQSHWVQAIAPYGIALLVGLAGPLSYTLCWLLFRKAQLGFWLLSALLFAADLLTIVLFIFPIIVGACFSLGWFVAFVRCQFEKSNEMFPAHFCVFSAAINLWMWETFAAGGYVSRIPSIGTDWFQFDFVWFLFFALPTVVPALMWMWNSRSHSVNDTRISS